MSADGCPPSLFVRESICAGVDLIVADVRAGLALLADASVQCIVTSPPYLGLRDYGIGGTDWPEITYRPRFDLPAVTVPAMRCVLGAEPSLLAFVGHLVLVARELHRVLRDDGTLWLNLGASYATGTTSARGATTTQGAKVPSGWAGRCDEKRWTPEGLPAKNLIPSPWAVAEALQADGWVLRAEVIWRKPNPMPEAVRDRPTVSHEQVFLLSKRGRYFYDTAAVAEPSTSRPQRRRAPHALGRKGGAWEGSPESAARTLREEPAQDTARRNARSVWSIPTQPFKGAHFATFPTELARRCILAGTRPGDVVLDPFAGSGTVGAVAKTLGRRAVLIEASARYAAECLRPRVLAAPGYQPALGGAR